MTPSRTSIFESIDPEILDQVASRREALRGGGKLGAALAMASVPVAFAATAREAFAQDGGGLPQQVVEILNFALTLEFLEAEFYEKGLSTSGLIPDETEEIFKTIRDHENEHVEFLQDALKGKATKKPEFDFTAGGKFNTFESYETFLLLSQAFEDTGVRAYKGQAVKLVDNPPILTQALTIHSVEARHAARVRRLRELQGWIPFEQPGAPKPVQPVYATDADLAQQEPSFDVKTTTKYNVDVANVSPVEPKQVTEAFDEPLGMDAVLKIVKSFIKAG